MPSTFTEVSTFEEKATEFKANAGQFNVDEALGIVECFVAGIGNKDSVGDVCLPGAFAGSLKRRKPRVVWGHNWNEPIGKVLDIYEVGPNDPRLPSKMRSAGIGGLYARVQFNLKSERGKEAFHSVVFFGEEQEWSIGYKTLDAVFDPSQQANLLKEVELYEVSPVLHGANQLTGTISIKSDKPLRDPKGGLTAAGRAHFKRTEGANLKPGVKGPADTPEKMRRKGSFLTRFYTNPSGPLVDDDGEPTRLALAAAAWGEPVPKNRQDAAELAAKGRRMLERYENTKKKSAKHEVEEKGIYSSPEVASNTTVGRVAELAKALSARFSTPVRVRTADRDMVVFDIENGGSPMTMRVTYYFDGDEFMFGEPQQVRAETVYIPANSPAGAMAGHAYRHGHDDDEDENEYAHEYREMLRGVEQKPHGDCGCGCDGAGTCGAGPKPMTWGMFKERTPGAHLFIRAIGQEKSEAFEMVQAVCDYHGMELKELEDGIAVPFIDSLSDDGYEAIMTIAENMSDSFDSKAIGGKLRRIGRTAGNMMDRFDPDAWDADSDRIVQEGTRFARPAPPRVNRPNDPRNMPRTKPIEVPEPAEVPIPQPKPTEVPQPSRPQPSRPEPAVPAGRRMAGSMGGPAYAAQAQFDTRRSRLANNMTWSPEGGGTVEVTYKDGKKRKFTKVNYERARKAGNPNNNIDDFIRELEGDSPSPRPNIPDNSTKKNNKLRGAMSPVDTLDKVIDAGDGDSSWEAWDEEYENFKKSLDDMTLDQLEEALDDLRERFQKFATGVNSEMNDEIVDRLTWGDEEGVAKHLMKYADMTKREAEKEASRLLDMFESASQVENAYMVMRDNLKERIKELEKEEWGD